MLSPLMGVAESSEQTGAESLGILRKQRLLSEASALGFDIVGVAGVDAPLRSQYYLDWIASGQHGEMGWMARNNDRRLEPKAVLPEAKSIVCLGMNYYQEEPEKRGRIAKYALGKDYHKVILKKLKVLCTLMREEWGGEQRPYVDTGPVLEKPIAADAGLGWQGKSTIVINEKLGTWLFLGVIFTTLELPADAPAKDRCGTCHRCLTACPTQAITAPYQLDARRCIAYLTIEHPGAIPMEFRKAIGDRQFGCDECLDVCPWNRHARHTREARFEALPHPDLRESLALDQESFDRIFAGTPIRRLGLSRWKRNACVVLGNIGDLDDLPSLRQAVSSGDELVREHALWAMAEIGHRGLSSK